MKTVSHKLFYPVIIVIIGIAVWANSVNVPFQFDDEHVILTNPDLNNPDTFAYSQKWFSFHGRPFSVFTFMLNYQTHGFLVGGYHYVNLLIHFISAVVLFFIIILLSQISGYNDRNKIYFGALAGSLVFLVHPLQVESVAYISQRMTSMAGMFFLLAYFFWLKFRSEKKLDILNLFIFSIFILFSFLSKQTALNIFPVLLVTEILLFSRSPLKTKYIIVSVIFAIFILLASVAWLQGVETRDSLLLSRKDYLFSQFPVIVAYIAKTIVPLSLNVDYDATVYSRLLNAVPLFSLVIILSVITGSWLIRKKDPLISLGILFFLAALSLECTVFPIKDLMADHRVYISMAGFAVIISALLYKINSNRTRIIVLTIIICSFSFLTISRNIVWQSETSLWKDATEKSPLKSRPWNNLGFSFLEKDKHTEAKKCFNRAIELNPHDFSAWNNLGVTAYKEKNYLMAVNSFYRSFVINNNYFPALNNIGKVLVDLKLYNHALFLFNQIIKKYTYPVDVLYNKAVCLEGLNRPEEAKKAYETVLQLDPSYVDAAYNLGVIYMSELKDTEAERYFNMVLKFKNEDTDAMNNIACIYYRNGRFEEARNLYFNILLIEPENAAAIKNLDNSKLNN